MTTPTKSYIALSDVDVGVANNKNNDEQVVIQFSRENIVELPTPEEYERLKKENTTLDDKVARLVNRNRELYASLSNASLHLTGDALETVTFSLEKASKGEKLFVIAGPDQQSKLAKLEGEVKRLKAELKAVREMRDSLVKDGHNCNISNVFMDEFILTMRKAEAQQADEKKGGE